jgi:hypothetical protein
MKRILSYIIGLLLMIALPVLGEVIAPELPRTQAPPAQKITSEAPSSPADPEPIVLPGPAAEADPEPTPRYILTDDERTEIEQVIMAEAGGECWEGQVAVAQCILNAAELEGIRPTEVLIEYRYTSRRIEPSESVRQAVAAVFDRGEVITSEPITLFYAPAIVYSKWHESQVHVLSIGGHKFFKEAQ